MPAGRPTTYDADFCEQVREMAEAGATDAEMAKALGVALSTFRLWRAKHPEFSAVLKQAKDAADDRVERSLFQRALGFTTIEQKLVRSGDDGASEEVVELVKEWPPDTTAAIFWLKNRRPREWRDRQEVAHDATGGLADLLRHVAERGGLIGHPQAQEGEE